MKKCFLMAAIVAVVSTGAALGASRVTYTLGLGGDNQAATYENSPAYPQFDTTVGTYTEVGGQTVNVTLGSVDLTWSVKVAVSGAHNDLVLPSGLANFAFTLELRDAADALVEGVIYHSTINDGDNDGFRGQVLGVTDPLHWAAFTFIYNINDAGVELAPGRVIDVLDLGGPGLTRYTYPSKTGAADSLAEPLAAAAPAGTLMGMGAGYPEYVAAELNDTGVPVSDYYFGIGMDDVVGSAWSYEGLGVAPLAEGQMNLCGLPSGTYTLKLISSKNDQNVSNNILEGDLDPDWELVGHFAALANEVVEAEITFVVNNDETCGCQEDLDCLDSDLCTVDTCVATVCQHSPVECPEGEVCDPDNGECVPEAECVNDGDCEDGNLCTTDTCVDGICTFPAVDCGEDICDPDTGECVECLSNDDCGAGEECVDGACVPTCTDPIMLSAASVMRHGGTTSATDYAIAINLNPTPYTIEPRAEGTISQHRLMFVFDQTIDISAASVVLNSGSIGSLTLATTNVANDTLVATMATAPTINTCWRIDVSGVKSALGGCTMTAKTLRVRLLRGDVNVNGGVNILDQNAVKGQLAKPVTSANFLHDVDASGTINILDQNAVKANLAKTANCP